MFFTVCVDCDDYLRKKLKNVGSVHQVLQFLTKTKMQCIYGQAHEVLVLIGYSQKPPVNAHQWRCQNAEKATLIKGRLLDQAVLLLISSLFKVGTSLKGKNLLPEGANSFL